MQVTWVIHSVTDPKMIHEMDHTGSQLREAVIEVGEQVCDLFLPPFSAELPEATDEPTVLYAGTRLVEAAALHPEWSKAVWYDAERSRWSVCQSHWQDLMLMREFQVMSFAEVGWDYRSSNEAFFVRPDADLKEFSGRIMAGFHLAQWGERIVNLDDSTATMDADTKIIVGKPLTIEREWRVFVVDSSPISGSRYNTYNTLDIRRELPGEVREVVQDACDTYLPAPVIAVDVGYAEGRYGIIEANAFNGSGWYDVDLPLVVREVSDYVRRMQ